VVFTFIASTQFFEFVKRIADDATEGTTVRLPPVLIQPMAADDVATAVARVAVGAPLNGMGITTGCRSTPSGEASMVTSIATAPARDNTAQAVPLA
jgi:hypothetical protein